MSSEQSNILKRQEQLTKWVQSDTDKAPKSMKEPEKIQFSKEVQFLSACNSNDWPEIERLLKSGININCTQDDGLTSLHQACIDDDENLVRFLIGQGALIDVQDKEGWTPLFAAISCNYLPITKYLISCGARLDTVSFDGELPLDQSTNEAIASFIKEEMKKQNLDPDEIRNRERTAMLHDIDIMKKTKDFSKFTLADNGGSLLHVAASKDYPDVLEKLLEIISLPMLNHTDKDGWNALHVAAHWGNKKACVLLIDADIDFDQVTKNNQTILEVSDDDAKPYIREEIRKARFRRQDRVSTKRPAQSPNVEYQPSETKIICPDKKSPSPVDKILLPSNCDQYVNASNDPKIESLGDNSTAIPDVVASTKIENIIVVESNTNEIVKESEPCDLNSTANTDIASSESISALAVTNFKPNDKIEISKIIESNDVQPSIDISSVQPLVKVVESESQRKDKARHVRSTRRSTQGVTAEEIDEAKKLMFVDKLDNSEQCSKGLKSDSKNVDSDPLLLNYKHNKEITDKTEMQLVNIESQKILPIAEITDKSINGDAQESDIANNNPDPCISVSNSESLEQTELKRKAGGSHLINKRKTRERLPTGIVDIKDIQAAQKELVEVDPPIILPNVKESEIDYKALYENEVKEKDKLQRNLARLRRDLEQSEDKIKNLQNNHLILKSQIQTSAIIPTKAEILTIERLREDNKKMKDANSALIRVISRLSHPSPKSLSSSS